MSRITADFLTIVVVSLLAGQSLATCLDLRNTSIPESTPTANYSINPDGTLSAPATALMWKRCLEGQTLSGGVCEGEPSTYNWADALVAAEAATFAGYDDWRLPNPKELLTIFEDRCSEPALNFELFPISHDFGAWTATPTAIMFQDLYDEVWIFGGNGDQSRKSKLATTKVLLVRDLP